MTSLKGYGKVKTYCYETTDLLFKGSNNWPFLGDIMNVWSLILTTYTDFTGFT